MPGFNYNKLQDTAGKLIARFGMDAAILRDGTDSYPVKCTITDYNPKYVDGKLIQFLDRKVMLSATGLPIVPDEERDKLIALSETLRIVTVKKASPGGVDVMYELQCRR